MSALKRRRSSQKALGWLKSSKSQPSKEGRYELRSSARKRRRLNNIDTTNNTERSDDDTQSEDDDINDETEESHTQDSEESRSNNDDDDYNGDDDVVSDNDEDGNSKQDVDPEQEVERDQDSEWDQDDQKIETKENTQTIGAKAIAEGSWDSEEEERLVRSAIEHQWFTSGNIQNHVKGIQEDINRQQRSIKAKLFSVFYSVVTF